MTDKYAVIGNPIAHSKSPQIHKMFAEQTGQDISYEAILAPLDGFAATIERLRTEGYKGCNVTVPFKFEACRIVNGVSSEVIDAFDSGENADAINTLDFRNIKITGYNTDGIGLLRDITQNLKCQITGKRVLLMGAGGAAYGVVHTLLDQQPQELIIANRTLGNVIQFEKQIRGTAKFPVRSVSVSSYPNLSGKKFDVVINATSSGLSDEMPPLPHGIFAPGALAYDMMYGRETPFMKFAREQGAAVVSDGLGMLVEQAAESFFIWRGVRPEAALVIAALRKQE
jgi:shikimate dehydrogenase